MKLNIFRLTPKLLSSVVIMAFVSVALTLISLHSLRVIGDASTRMSASSERQLHLSSGLTHLLVTTFTRLRLGEPTQSHDRPIFEAKVAEEWKGFIDRMSQLGAGFEHDIHDSARTISWSMQQQATAEIAQNTQQAAAGTSTVSESTSAVWKATLASAEVSSRLRSSATQIGAQLEGLKGQVDSFLGKVRDQARAA